MSIKYIPFLSFLLPLFLFGIQPVRAQTSNVLILNSEYTTTSSFKPSNDAALYNLDTTNLGNDGTEEIVAGSGPGAPPNVSIYRQDGSVITSFPAYHETFTGGINVTTCDLNNDGKTEIVTGTLSGGGPHVRIFDTYGNTLFNGGFFAYDKAFRGGVNVACGDVNQDGSNEIITGAGIGGGPHIRIFTPQGRVIEETFAGDVNQSTGVSVATADLNGDGDMEVLSTPMSGTDTPAASAFDILSGDLRHVLNVRTDNNYGNGLSVVGADVDHDGMDEIGIATRHNSPAFARFYEMTGRLAASVKPAVGNESAGLSISTITSNQGDRLVVMPYALPRNNAKEKFIRVDVSEQRLYAYEDGRLIRSFLVSTGRRGYDTPFGTTSVTDKLLWHDYRWTYGPNDPRNYFIPDVKYNLRFRPHYYIHYAYWHNNFGHRMSHGCVNASEKDAKWIYHWADVGTKVHVQP